MTPLETWPTISDVRLERYRLGELPLEESQAIAGHPALRQRLSELEQSDRDTAAAYPATQMTEAIRRRSREQARFTRNHGVARPRAWLLPASIVATCVCVAAVATSVWLRPPTVDDTTIKGGGEISLVLHRRVADGSEALRPGAVVRQGDQIRIGYRASGRSYGAILSMDGRGTLTQHLPAAGDRAAGLQATGTAFLDFAYELDDAPRWEAFYFVTADAPFDLEPVRRAVRAAAASRAGSPAPLVLPTGLRQSLFSVNKDPR